MPTRVRFRLNKITGEVEEFVVDDQDRRLPEAEHDRIALAVGEVIERRPGLSEIRDAPCTPAGPATDTRPGDSATEAEPTRQAGPQ